MIKENYRIILFVLLLLYCLPTHVIAEELAYESLLIEDLSLVEINDFWRHLQDEFGSFLPEILNKDLGDLIQGKDEISFKSMILGLLHYLFYELVIQSELLGTLIMLTLFSIILQSIQNAFAHHTVSKVAYFVVFTVLIYILLSSFYAVFSYAQTTIQMMNDFMIALLPILLVLIISSGQVMTVSFFHPIIIFLVHVCGLLVNYFIFPLLFFSILLMLTSYINERFQMTYLADLLKSIGIGTLSVFVTLFLGVMSIQGAATAFQDGIALKTTKFISANFIPVVGRTFTDAAESILLAAQLLKNTIGIVGMFIIVCIVMFPAVKILVISFIFKLTAAILQPLGNGPIIESLSVVSKYMMYIVACLITVSIMFFLVIVILIVASNIPLLMK